MTAQSPEMLRYEAQDWHMCTEPLHAYLAQEGITFNPTVVSTNLRRNYIGSWEIVDDRLYLIGIVGCSNDKEISLETLFPGSSGRVFAHWFTGTIRAPHGRLLKYVHGGYASQYERDLLLEVDNGVVRERRVRENGTAPPEEMKKPSWEETIKAFLGGES
jgi:hypothetical protein